MQLENQQQKSKQSEQSGSLIQQGEKSKTSSRDIDSDEIIFSEEEKGIKITDAQYESANKKIVDFVTKSKTSLSRAVIGAVAVYQETHSIPLATVFSSLVAIWGKTWCAHLYDTETAQIAASSWARGLSDLTDEEIKMAIKKLSVKCEFAPTLAQFRKAALGIVTPAQAYSRWRAGENEGLIGQSASFTSWEMGNWTEKDIKDRFLANYAALVDEVLEVE